MCADATRHAALGRPFPAYETLAPYEQRVQERFATITADMHRDPTRAEVSKVRGEEAHRQRCAVAGYDLVFSPVKSAALLWALDHRAWVRDAVKAAHDQAVASTVAMLERHAAFTRTGKGGVAQVDTKGLVAVAFDHHDSRDGDPNLHTHLVVANKIQGTDGKWRSLDARTLYRIASAASEHYDTAFETALTSHLPITFTSRPDTVAAGRRPIREITGVPTGWVRHFSRRHTALSARFDDLVNDYRERHGRDPNKKAAFALARQATLETRAGKKPPRALAAMRQEWRDRVTSRFGPTALEALRLLIPNDQPTPTPTPTRAAGVWDVASLARQVIDQVAQARSTWTRWHVHAEAERLIRQRTTTVGPLPDLDQHNTLVTAIVDHALSPGVSVQVQAPAVTDEPASLRRSDGQSVFAEHAAAQYTSTTILNAETRLLQAAQTPSRVPPLAAVAVTAVLDGFDTTQPHQLDSGQRALVTAFATSPFEVVVGLGAAGTGKTTAMAALNHVLTQHDRRLIPLATSSAAAAVLSAELGIPADNLHKFLHEHLHGPHAHALREGLPVPVSHEVFTLRAGDVVLVDEASMAPTLLLDQLHAIAAQHGAVVRLLGDWRQLGAVESGGVLRLIATDVGAAELATLHRFRHPDEAAATLALRVGDTESLDFYTTQDRVQGGSVQAMVEAVYTQWRTDMLAGKTSVMIAATNQHVITLSARARLDRVAADQVTPDGVALADGNVAGVGDWIVTRRNDRTNANLGGHNFVKNGDLWTVTTQHPDGSLTVRHFDHHGQTTLAAPYVARHVQLAYASTVHRAEGSTMDTSHTLITADLGREHLYVALTRGRDSNHLYVITHRLPEHSREWSVLDRPRHDPKATAAVEVLTTILARSTADVSATETIRTSQDQAVSLHTLAPRYLHAVDTALREGYHPLLHTMLGPTTANLVLDDPAYAAVVRALRRAEQAGWQPQHVLRHAVVGQRPLSLAESAARALAWRINTITAEHVAPALLRQPEPADIHRYQVMLQPLLAGIQLDPDTPLTAPTRLHSAQPDAEPRPAAGTVDFVPAVTAVLGDRLTNRAAQETAWPALNAALHRAEQAGHQPAPLLRQLGSRRDLVAVGSISEVLAWRINDHLRQHPTPPPADQAEAWKQLAWTLKAHEHAGGDPAKLLRDVAPGADLTAIAVHVQSQARQHLASRQHHGLPPWLTTTNTSQVAPDVADYLASSVEQLRTRVNQLTDTAITDRPSWTTVFGDQPDDPRKCELWRDCVGVAAAYRDQHQITDDTTDQPLGPYILEGRAGHGAYHHAATAIITAHHLTNPPEPEPPEPSSGSGNAGGGRNTDPAAVTSAMVADVYRNLNPDQQAAVTATLRQQLGPLCFHNPSDPATVPTVSAAAFAHALHQHGHLTTSHLTTHRRTPDDPAPQRSQQRRPQPARIEQRDHDKHHRARQAERLARQQPGRPLRPATNPEPAHQYRPPTHRQPQPDQHRPKPGL